MFRPSDLFAIAAIVLLVWMFCSRVFAFPSGMVLHIHGLGVVFGPTPVYLGMASLLCLCAAAYAFWPTDIGHGFGVWHFWITILSMIGFWAFFYLMSLQLP